MDIVGDIVSISGSALKDLSAWLNGATAFVAVWYDQSGAGNHITQSVNANQPYISSKFGVRFTGGIAGNTIELIRSSFTGFRNQADQPHTIFVRYDTDTILSQLDNLFAIGNPATHSAIAFHPSILTPARAAYYFFNNDVLVDVPLLNGTLTLRYQGGIGIDKRSIFHNSLSQQLTANSASVGTTALNLGVNPPLRIGNWSARNSSTAHFGHNGNIYECIIYNSFLSNTNVLSISENMK
jgi:hypothetical protein